MMARGDRAGDPADAPPTFIDLGIERRETSEHSHGNIWLQWWKREEEKAQELC